jgi:hypothetical protein
MADFDSVYLIILKFIGAVTREDNNSTAVKGRRLAVPDAKTYVEVSGKLLVWAVKSKSSHTRAQFALLASTYKNLVERAARKAREVTSTRAVRPAWRQQRQPARAVDSPMR